MFKYKNILRGRLTSASCSKSAPDLGFPGSLATPHPTKSEQIVDLIVAKYLFVATYGVFGTVCATWFVLE